MMAMYRVRPGFTHGLKDEYKAGDLLELEPSQARSFADKLELIVEPEAPNDSAESEVMEISRPTLFDVSGSTVSAVLAAVESGVITAADALAAEVASRNRTTLVKALTELANGANA